MARIWVAVVNISPRVAQKIICEHAIEPDEVRQALIGVSGLRFAWDDDAERGWRALVKAHVRGSPTLFVLYPVDDTDHDGEWNLGSAYFI